jgi:outer membrane protein assembly factor BamE (lipoprotein component of BamABCDE complex)
MSPRLVPRRPCLLLILCLILCLAVAPAGCAVMGRQQKETRIDANSVARLKEGMTKSEVTQILGAPQEIIFSNKEHDPLREHAYIYEHETTHYTGIVLGIVNFGNADTKKDRVVVFFDDGGRVDHLGTTLDADRSGFGFPFGQ